jgi:plasmid stability protein
MSTHSLTIRNLSDETFFGIKAYAKTQGKSVEAALRSLLDQTARPVSRVKFSALIQPNVSIDLLDLQRDKKPYQAVDF